MLHVRHYSVAALASSAFLLGCGGSPPSDRVLAEITRSVLSANTAMFEGSAGGAEVVGIELAGWKEEEERISGTPANYTTAWTARLRFTEPLACILAEVDGTKIVRVVAEKGEELPFHGTAGAMNWQGKWEVNAYPSNEGDFTGPGAWKPIWERVPGLTMGYPVTRQGSSGNPVFRARNFEPVSRLEPCIVEGSPEHEKLVAEAQERWRKAQETAAEQARQRQVALEEQRRKAEAEAAERQRLAQEERERQKAEAAERARVAAEESKRKAEEQRHARLLAVLAPFQSATGAVIVAEAGVPLGTLLLDPVVDDPKLAVSGRAVDLREMPFEDFTYEGSVDERGVFAFKSSRGGDPTVYGASGEKLGSRAGFTIAALSGEDRARMDSLLAVGKRLGGGPPVELSVEILDAEAAKTREPQLHLAGLAGTVFYRGRANAAVVPLFAADLGANRAYAWRNKEVVSIRLNAPAKGAGLYIRGTASPSTELVVTINGVHKATVASIPKLGGALLAFPSELEVLDVRLEATGSVSSRTIGLVK